MWHLVVESSQDAVVRFLLLSIITIRSKVLSNLSLTVCKLGGDGGLTKKLV